MNPKITITGLFLLLSISAFPQNNLPYLGQAPPDLMPRRFPPDSLLSGNEIEGRWHGCPMFSTDGLEMFWTKYTEPNAQTWKLELFTMRVEDNNWSPVRRPVFADLNVLENNPFFSSGGDTLYYFSDKTDTFINMVVRNGSGWSNPQPVQIPLPDGCSHGSTFSVAKNQDIYLDLQDQNTMDCNIYVSKFQNGSYQLPEVLDQAINSEDNETCPFIDPDQDYLIFSSGRPGGFGNQLDLYISFKNADQSWTKAVNMGYKINATSAFFPIVTLDKKYLFFNTAKPGDIGYNPYWISSAIIDTLRKMVGVNENFGATGHMKLYQNYPNPVIDKTTFSFDLDHPSTLHFEIYSIINGSKLNLFEKKIFQKGRQSFEFDASLLPAGIYIYKLTSSEGITAKRKMVIL